MKIKRLILDLIIFVSLFWAPWWFSMIFCIFLIFYLNSFYESMFVGLALDALYGVGGGAISSHFFVLVLTVVFLASYLVKDHFVFSNK